MKHIREPAVSGSFYPSDEVTLRKDLEGYLSKASSPGIDGDVVGLVSPHAGYMYSAEVAAAGYKAIQNKPFHTVIIVAPSHRVYFEGASLMATGAYRTPLGLVKIEEDLSAEILNEDAVFISDMGPHIREHALEVQLPFLQVALSDFLLVPIIMGSQSVDVEKRVSRAIFRVLRERGPGVLVVASTDLSHYHSYGDAVALDRIVLKHLTRFDVDGLESDFAVENFEACGGGPLLSVMRLSRDLGANKGKVLKYMNSGDVTGDKSTVVGYVSSVFYRFHQVVGDGI